MNGSGRRGGSGPGSSTFTRGAGRMSDPAVERIVAYWEGLRNGRALPARAEVDPRGLGDAIGNAFLVERIAPGEVRLRIAGRHLCDLMGMEVQGMPLSALFAGRAREQLADSLAQLFELPARVQMALAGSGIAGARLTAEMQLLPLADREGRATRALGALASRGVPPAPPCRFLIRDASARPIGAAAAGGVRAFDHELAEDQAPFAHASRPPRRGRPQLRLIRGGREDDETAR